MDNNKKCDTCINGWKRISENGYCVKCILSRDKAINCLTNVKSFYVEKQPTNKFTKGNKDDINSAIEGLAQFCHSFCMNVEETERQDDLVFRCEECPFGCKETHVCSVKRFLHKYGTPEQFDKSTCMGSL